MSPSPSNFTEINNGLLLYFHKYSFYAQKVLMALHEKKLSYKSHVIDIAKGEQYQPWFLDINPRGEIPVLKDGVKIIPDSARIIDYLEDNFSNGDTPRLVPLDQGLEIRQKVAHFRDLLSKIPANVVTVGSFYHPELTHKPKLPFIAPVRAVMKANYGKMGSKLREMAEKNPSAREALLSKAEEHETNLSLVVDKDSYSRLLDQVDNTLGLVDNQLASNQGENKWLVTERLTVADIELIVLLERLDLVGLGRKLLGTRQHLGDYLKKARTTDAYRSTMPGFMFHATALIGEKVLLVSGAAALVATVAAAFYFTRKSD